MLSQIKVGDSSAFRAQPMAINGLRQPTQHSESRTPAITNQQIAQVKRLLKVGKLLRTEIASKTGLSLRIIGLVDAGSVYPVKRRIGEGAPRRWMRCDCGSVALMLPSESHCLHCAATSRGRVEPPVSDEARRKVGFVSRISDYKPRGPLTDVASLPDDLVQIATLTDVHRIKRLPKRIERRMQREIEAATLRIRAARVPVSASGPRRTGREEIHLPAVTRKPRSL